MAKRSSSFIWYLALLGFVAILTIFSLTFQQGIAKTLSIVLLAFVLFLTITFVYLDYLHPSRSLRQKLRSLEQRLSLESVDVLKEEYLALYKMYLLLSESKKQNFYARVDRLREQIERQLAGKRQLERLLTRAEQAPLADLQAILGSVQQVYQTLSQKLQEEYGPAVSYLRDKLERG